MSVKEKKNEEECREKCKKVQQMKRIQQQYRCHRQTSELKSHIHNHTQPREEEKIHKIK